MENMEDEVGDFSWQCTIEKVNNGFVFKDSEGRVSVFEINNENTDETNAEQVCFMNMIYKLQEEFSINYGKHNKTNLEIKIIDYE